MLRLNWILFIADICIEFVDRPIRGWYPLGKQSLVASVFLVKHIFIWPVSTAVYASAQTAGVALATA